MQRFVNYCLCLLFLTSCAISSHDSDETVDSLYYQGRQFLQIHYYDSALTCFSKAEENFTECTSMRRKGQIYANLASLYKDASIYVEAMDYAEQSLEAYLSLHDTACILLSWMDIADIYTHMDVEDKYELAQQCYDKALTYFEYYVNDSIKGRVYQEKGMKFVLSEQLDSAIYYLFKSMQLPAQGNAMSIRSLYMGLAYQKQNTLDSAKYYTHKALSLPNALRQRSGCYNVLLRIARAEDDTMAINHYSNILVNYKDSILHLENQTAKRIVSLNNASQHTIRQHYKCRIVWWTIAGVCLLVGVALLGHLFRRKVQQQKDQKLNQMLTALQEKLEEEENRKAMDRTAVEMQLNSLKKSVEVLGIKSFDHWKERKEEASQRYFYSIMDRLYVSFPFLSERELHLCLLVLIKMSNEEMANVLCLSPKSMSKTKKRVAERLGTPVSQLREYLLQCAF